MESRVINCDGIGDIRFKRDSRSSKIKITVRSRNDIRVTMPRNVPFSVAELFVMEKVKWINDSLEKIESESVSEILFDESSTFATRNHRLIIERSPEAKSSARISGSAITVKYDCTREVSDPHVQKFIISSIESALRKEARAYLPARTEELAAKYGFTYRKVFLKNAKTRWGSCSGENNINLNIHLMRLPDIFIDYVILHELAHTVEKNHSQKFWNLLDSLVGDAKKIRRDMRKYRTSL